MIIEKFERLVTRLIDKVENKTETSTNKIVNTLQEKDLYKINNDSKNEMLAKFYNDIMLDFTNAYNQLVEPYEDFARQTTVPLSWPYFQYLKNSKRGQNNILFADGVHFFVALQGGGKSSISYELITRLIHLTGKSAYINADYELPRYDEVSKKYYKYFQYFKLMDFFDMSVKDDDPNIQVSQLKKFNRNFDTIVLDEWLTEMNHRLNKTKDYNNIFMALLTMIAHMRHQKIKRIYVLSQIDNTDIQLLSMFKYIHEVEVDLDVTYLDWVESGSLKRHIKGWWVWTYGVKRNRKKQVNEKELVKKQYISATAEFEYFNTLAQAAKYSALTEDKIKFIKEVN